MKISELILAVGDDKVKFQNLDQCASDLNYTARHGTKIVFGTDQPLDFNGTKDLGPVVWMPRDAVAKALASFKTGDPS